jgi:glycosyltransferase involved in cell wall biosynthesis
MINSTAFSASILITTKNRKDELRKAIQSSLAQTAAVEVVVIDDGSTDGTADMVRSEFPQVKLDRSETSLGLIAQRNRGADLASSPVIISIDDDCVFPSIHTVEQTLVELDDPRIGVVAMPMINILQNQTVCNLAPDGQRMYVSAAFNGGAHAMRRDLFIRLGRYRAFLWRQGEESDFAIRMLEAGYVVRMGRADPIHHMESPNRNRPLILFYVARCNLLYAWWNVPMPFLPIHMAGTTLNLLKFGLRERCLWPILKGLGRGYIDCLRHFRQRRPVRRKSYRLMRRIVRRGAMPLEEIQPLLNPMIGP